MWAWGPNSLPRRPQGNHNSAPICRQENKAGGKNVFLESGERFPAKKHEQEGVGRKTLMVQRRRLKTVASLALVPGLVTGCASGGNPFKDTNDFDRTFIGAAQTWDLDKNGSVSCDEWTQYLSTSFREVDVNGDGFLDATEFPNLIKNDRLFEIANIAYYDTNGDGKLTLDEMTGKQNVAFKLLDRNQDCQIDRTESVQVRSIDLPAKDTGTGQGGPPPAGPGGR
jgi:Ca2+-binding EF-hand superfamily protein